MYPPGIAQYVESAISNQTWFLQDSATANSLRLGRDLNTGIINTFNFARESTNCTDAKSVFGTTEQYIDSLLYDAPHNFWSCAFYPNLTRDYLDLRLSHDDRAQLQAKNIDLSLSTSMEVSAFLAKCLVAYCETSQECNLSSCSFSQLMINSTLLSASSVDHCLDNICASNVERWGNPDIAGIGVIMSYFIQFGIALIGTLGLGIILVLGKVLQKTEEKTESKMADAKPRMQTATEILTIALDEFQRAQCCFSLAISIASLVFLETRSNELSPWDRFTIVTVSIGAMVPTALVLCTLIGMKSRSSSLTFSLTCVAWVLSFVVRIHPKTKARNIVIIDDSIYPQACGSISPSLLCQPNPESQKEFLETTRWVHDANEISNWVLYPILLHYVVSHFHSNRYIISLLRHFRLYRSYARMSTSHPKIKNFLIAAYVLCFSGLCLASMIIYTTIIGDMWRADKVNTEWGFGQIVALTVWLPTLLSFVNDCIYGPVRGRTVQLPPTLKVVRTEGLETVPRLGGNGAVEAKDENINVDYKERSQMKRSDTESLIGLRKRRGSASTI